MDRLSAAAAALKARKTARMPEMDINGRMPKPAPSVMDQPGYGLEQSNGLPPRIIEVPDDRPVAPEPAVVTPEARAIVNVPSASVPSGDDARDRQELLAAQEADRESRFTAGMELAGRQLVGGITRTPVGQGLGPNPSEVPAAMEQAKSRRTRAAEALARQRQEREDALGHEEKALDRSSRAAALLRAEREKTAAQAESARRFEISHGDAQANAAATRGLAAASLGMRKTEIEKKDAKDLDDDVQKLGKELPGDVADFGAKYARIKAAMARHPDDIPGVGVWDSNKPSALASTEDFDVQKDAGQMLAAYQKLITGAGASDAERANLAKISLDLNNEKSFASGLESLKAAYEAKVRDVRARFKPEVVKKLEEGQRREGATAALVKVRRKKDGVTKAISKAAADELVAKGSYEVVP